MLRGRCDGKHLEHDTCPAGRSSHRKVINSNTLLSWDRGLPRTLSSDLACDSRNKGWACPDVSRAQVEENQDPARCEVGVSHLGFLCVLEGVGTNRVLTVGTLTLMVLSPEADTMYLSSKSTTLTAARWPTRTRRRVMSVAEAMSHTAMERSLEQVTISPLLKRRWSTASLWWISVFRTSPVFTSQTLGNRRAQCFIAETTRKRCQGLCSEPSVSVNINSRLGSVGFTCTWWLGPDTMLTRSPQKQFSYLWRNVQVVSKRSILPRYSGMVFAGLCWWQKIIQGSGLCNEPKMTEKMAWWLGSKHEILHDLWQASESIIYPLQTGDSKSWCLFSHHTNLPTWPRYGQSQRLQLP